MHTPYGDNKEAGDDEEVLLISLWNHLRDHSHKVKSREGPVRSAIYRRDAKRPEERDVLMLMVALEQYRRFLEDMVLPIAKSDGKAHVGESADREQRVETEE